MHFSTILPVIAVALGAANAAPVDDDLVEPRAPRCPLGINLITIKGFRNNPTGVFTGVGVPGQCEPLPPNVQIFRRDTTVMPVLACFECTVFSEDDCSGSTFSVTRQALRKGQKHTPWKSWLCDCKS
ncbi:hypothetical protein BGZ61DRAFT_451855 [Ilyonectria robusta]|uniref:uncharacterized protein n=1 Tax=Ilyonectria robusta TaxID=1079257 RepID=UPI001E8CCEA6|nr:uncharacterized protein BGZ61DRAFT_451855 [Ilyonectria robusta]KAH8694386.1 hypothetical protein BGZ61DRAFT_451855 [Ilyonectria robusta]